MSKFNALIAGSTGLIGNHILQQLMADTDCEKIILLVRRPLEVNSPKVEVAIVDFDKLNDFVLSLPVHYVFCSLGTTIKTAGSQDAFRTVDFTFVVNLAKWCENNKVQAFLLVSAMGANAGSKVFYNRIKGEAEQAVSQLKIPAVHIFRPSLLMGNRTEKRFGERMAQCVMGTIGFLFVGSLKNIKGIHASKVASAMIGAAKTSTSGTQIHLSGEMQNN